MTAVASPPSFQPNSRSEWGASLGQGGLNAMNADEVARMFMPRKSAQRSNSSSSITSSASSSSSTTTLPAPSAQTNGVSMSASGDLSTWTNASSRKKAQRTGPWPASKSEAISGVSSARPQSILATNGASASASMTSIHQPIPMLPSQHLQQSPSQQLNGSRASGTNIGEGNPVLYLLSMNGTFERKTILVPYYPDSIRIGRQTNAKTVPTPANGFFDSKVLSRQHAEIWADRSGKVWIRDVKSSNGTFVNGARLSPENRESEPHELQSQDHLELGIDIVSEDQKTVVHHKVAAKVEHSGFLGSSNNVLDMNFGDLDPVSGSLVLQPQNGVPMRGRAGSQGSVASSGRMSTPSSVAGSQISGMGHQRPMNFWLTPVTTEVIVKRLNHEMRAARLQTNDLGRADEFFGTLVSKENIKEIDKPPGLESPQRAAQSNGGLLPLRSDIKPRFSDPPAPPPQQPLPEKPDLARSYIADNPISPVSLKRSNTERPRSVPNASPIRQEQSSQIMTLVEALASAKKEIDSQSARMRDLEEMLSKERQARELAEDLARRLEAKTAEKANVLNKSGGEISVLEEAFDPPADSSDESLKDAEPNAQQGVDTNGIDESSTLLEKRLEAILSQMKDMRDQMESFKHRAETAESERDADRKTLGQMVAAIRAKDASKSALLIDLPSQATEDAVLSSLQNGYSQLVDLQAGSLLQKSSLPNGHAIGGSESGDKTRSTVSTLSRQLSSRDQLFQNTTPYASMIGVVLIGMGLMAYLNGWHSPKADR